MITVTIRAGLAPILHGLWPDRVLSGIVFYLSSLSLHAGDGIILLISVIFSNRCQATKMSPNASKSNLLWIWLFHNFVGVSDRGLSSFPRHINLLKMIKYIHKRLCIDEN